MGPTRRNCNRGGAPPSFAATQNNNNKSPGGNRTANFANIQLSPMTQSQLQNLKPVSEQLPNDEKLVNTKEFQLTAAKYLACGEKVRVYPETSEFRIRILNMDFASKVLRNYVEFSKASFDELIRHVSEIERYISEKLVHRVDVFQYLGLFVAVVPDVCDGCNGVEFRSDNCYSQMLGGTFHKLINYKEQVDREYYLFEKKLEQDMKVIKKVLNMFAYVANDNRSNTVGVEEPSETNQTAIMKTSKTLLKQMGTLVQRENNNRENNI